MAFNSDEVNLLVYRYLEESGFRHSAFTFGYESNVLNAGIDGSTAIPRGALMRLLQKGALFAEAEVFSLIEGELDSIRFEKAIGCMTILECVMCDAAKTKALQRRTGILRPQNAAEDVQRTPSRIGSGVDQPSTAAHQHQNHGMTPSRPESTSSAKSANMAFQQQQQVNRDREFRSQQSAATLQSGNPLPPKGAYRTVQGDRFLGDNNSGNKCNPTLASTSTGLTSLTTSNHLHPGTNSTAVMGSIHHPFYHQQTFGKPINLGHPETSSNAYFTISNGSTNTINGPSAQTLQQQINNSSTNAYSSLTNLHNQQGMPNNQTTAADISRIIGDRMILNGTSSSYSSTMMGTKRGTGN